MHCILVHMQSRLLVSQSALYSCIRTQRGIPLPELEFLLTFAPPAVAGHMVPAAVPAAGKEAPVLWDPGDIAKRPDRR